MTPVARQATRLQRHLAGGRQGTRGQRPSLSLVVSPASGPMAAGGPQARHDPVHLVGGVRLAQPDRRLGGLLSSARSVRRAATPGSSRCLGGARREPLRRRCPAGGVQPRARGPRAGDGQSATQTSASATIRISEATCTAGGTARKCGPSMPPFPPTRRCGGNYPLRRTPRARQPSAQAALFRARGAGAAKAGPYAPSAAAGGTAARPPLTASRERPARYHSRLDAYRSREQATAIAK